MPASPRRPLTLRPRFTLALLYLFFFFILYCFVFIMPAMWEVLRSTPVGPEQQELAQQLSQQTIQPRIHWIAALAIATTGLGMYYEALPGMKR